MYSSVFISIFMQLDKVINGVLRPLTVKRITEGALDHMPMYSTLYK